ncbi:MAG: bifunctional lysine ketoglutarate reductase /saccharopine dehydrogenase family protein [Candidatus Bipolaricaulota bacterium]
MPSRIGIRREDKYDWERRTPLTPQDAKELADKHGIKFIAQTSPNRVFGDKAYQQAGITVAQDLSSCPVVLGIKEIPIEALNPETTYVFFSHTIKGQSFNMPMLRHMLSLNCTLIDYEKITDDNGRRLIFFGNYAGLVGMIESLWAMQERLAWEGIETPFQQIRRVIDCPDLASAKKAIRSVGERIKSEGLPSEISPLVVGFAGYGNVSRGAQEILDLLPTHEIPPQDLATLTRSSLRSDDVVYKVVFKEEDIAERIDTCHPFDLQDYYQHPKRYRGIFSQYLPYLDVLINAIYWDKAYPRLITKQAVKKLYEDGDWRLRVIGDITCDVEGAIECTLKSSNPHNHVYVYDPIDEQATDGVKGNGPVIMAVDILPAELPHEASIFFSGILQGFVPSIAQADFTTDLDSCGLPPQIKRAVIVYKGELTPDYRYIEQFLL